MPAGNRRARRAFTLVEVLVCLALVVVLTAFLVPQLPGIRDQSELLVARQQAMALQTALDAWLAAQPSVAGARSAFAGDHPTDPVAFLQQLRAHLAEEAAPMYVPLDGSTLRVRTAVMEDRGWYLEVVWPGATWLETPPRVFFHGPTVAGGRAS